MIEVINLEKSFFNGKVETKVLKGINLKIEKGEFVSIMGKSGAGKSTLMYQMSLLDHPTKGSIVVADQKTENLTRNERTRFRLEKLGYVFQDYALLPELTALENTFLPLLMQGKSKKEAIKIASETLEKIGLGHRLTNRPSQMSGGEQQRVSIARAVAHKPVILFADEPTANLDTASATAVLELFKSLHQEGQTIIMVTHEPEYALYSEKIIELSDGQVINIRPPQK